MAAPERLVELRSVIKEYRGLRPLRISHLDVHEGESIALLGFDQASAEVLVNLITGAMLPDSGDIRVMGQYTRDIPDSTAWLHTLDQFGLVSERAVFLDQLTAEQNLAVPFSLELEELPPEVRGRVRSLAGEVGLGERELHQPMAALPHAMRLRVRLGRALALNPRVLLAEHPNAALPPPDAPAFAADLARIVAQRGIASIVMTADSPFAHAIAEEVLTLQPATGELKRGSNWRRWFS
jgi:ABC-type transporter Mla maintaining outer membrane lipid asymmetry ATPase subunit MlaF